ncbi:MAG: hypothetical protein IJU48_08565 [Synergistaceae bacterium]|nr:hypothetical protein [Synergistaceae bacterium]
MYEIDLRLKDYYDELEPKLRLEILDNLAEDDTVKFLHELYCDRYSDHENKGCKNVDWWLWRCICLQILYGRGKIFRKSQNKELMMIIDELRMSNYAPESEAYLYHEYKNLARRYLSTCKSDGYASRMMGFKKATDEEKVIKACSDIWQMSRGIAKKFGLEEKMRLWIEAFHDELMKFSPVCREEYERLDAKGC